MQEFGLLNVAIVATYLIGNLYLGFAMSRRIHTANEYYIGDKSTPWWAIGISVMATYVSALLFRWTGLGLYGWNGGPRNSC